MASAVISVRLTTDPGPSVLAMWDRLVRVVPGSDVAQLSAWAQVRAGAGYEPLYLLASRQGTLVGGAQILRRAVPVLGGVGYLPYGPVSEVGESTSEVRGAVCGALRELSALRLRALFVQPSLGDDALSEELLGRGFRASQAGIAPSASLRVDLSRSEDELHAGLSRRLRTWTRHWDQRGVAVRLGGAADVQILAALAARSADHHGFTGFDTSYLDTMYRALSPERDVVLLIAELHGTPVAAELLTTCGGVFKSRITGLDRTCAEAMRLNVAGALIWTAIRYGKAHGFRWFDFGGVRASTADLLLSGVPVDRTQLPGPDQFKLAFGGSVYTYPQPVERIGSPLARSVYDLGRDTRVGQHLLTYAKRLLRGGTAHSSSDQHRASADSRADPDYHGPPLPVRPRRHDEAVTVTYRGELEPALGGEWDLMVAAQPGADVTQLTAWGRLRRAAGYEPTYLLAYRGAALVGGAQLLRRRVPVAGSIGYLPYGPLIFTSTTPAAVRAALSGALRDLPALGLRALFVQPPEGSHELSEELLALGFRHSVAGIAPRASVHIDLSHHDDELYSALSRKLRRWTKRWAARGVHVRLGDHTDLPLLARLHAHTADHHSFKPLSMDYLQRLYTELTPGGHAQLFVGEIDQTPVAALLATGCGGVLKTRISGFDRSEATAELRVPAAIRWTAIQWAKQHSYRWFDFGGLSESSTRTLLAGQNIDPAQLPGPDQFKLSFGGSAYHYPPAIELITTPALRHVYNLTTRFPGGRHLQTLIRTALRGGHNRR